MARFLETSAAVLLVAAIVIALAFGTAAYFDVPAKVALCENDENAVACARNWIAAAAVFAGFLTIFFVAIQVRTAQRQHIEQMDLQTRPMRAGFSRVLGRLMEQILKQDIAVENAIMNIDFANPGTNVEKLLTCITSFRPESWFEDPEYQQIAVYDRGKLDRAIRGFQELSNKCVETITALQHGAEKNAWTGDAADKCNDIVVSYQKGLTSLKTALFVEQSFVVAKNYEKSEVIKEMDFQSLVREIEDVASDTTTIAADDGS